MNRAELRKALTDARKSGKDTLKIDGQTWRRRKWTGMIESIEDDAYEVWDRYDEPTGADNV